MLKHFQFRDDIARAWKIIEKVSRRAWDRKNKPSQAQKNATSKAAGNFLVELHNAVRDLPQKRKDLPDQPPRGQDIDKNNWGDFWNSEIANTIGREDINSVAEAFLKSMSLLETLQRSMLKGDGYFIFRGQRNIKWDLLSRKGRAINKAVKEERRREPTKEEIFDKNRNTDILQEELDSLREFQEKWEHLDNVDEIDKARKIGKDDPEWWFRMQHYDTGDGTRLLDVTTSLTAALLFACVDWRSGSIDDSTDGVIYLWVTGTNGNVDDFILRKMPKSMEGLFAGFPNAPRYIVNPVHNERSKAQAGGFYWWPEFWKEAPYGAPYYLRVAKHAKSEIVRHLISMDVGPKTAVRGIQGYLNEQRLRQELGLGGWNPLALRDYKA